MALWGEDLKQFQMFKIEVTKCRGRYSSLSNKRHLNQAIKRLCLRTLSKAHTGNLCMLHTKETDLRFKSTKAYILGLCQGHTRISKYKKTGHTHAV